MNLLKNIGDKLWGLNTVAGVEVEWQGENVLRIFYTLLTKRGNVVLLDETGEVNAIEALSDKIPATTPLSLSVTGKGVLTKTISQTDELTIADSNALLNNVIPNANSNDFYLQQSALKNDLLVSVVRKDLVDGLLKALTEKHFIINCSIACHLLPENQLINEKDNGEVSFGLHTYFFDGGEIETYKRLSDRQGAEKLDVAGEKIQADYVTSYLAAINTFISVYDDGIANQQVVESKSEFKNKKIFRVAGFSSLALIFLVLLVNYFVFSTYNTSNQELAYRLSTFRSLLIKSDSLQGQIAQKEAFFTTTGWLGSPNLSYYADRIASGIPDEVILEALKVYPYNDKKSKDEHRSVFEQNTVVLSGYCSDAAIINPWISKLKNTAWVADVNIKNYHFDHKENKGVFTLNIQLP